MSLSTIIFDLDGTLLDTLDDIGSAMNRVLSLHGFPIHPMESYRFFVGEGAARLVARALPEEKRELAPQLLNEFLKDYESNWAVKSRPYDGIPELLAHLKGQATLCILSNKPDHFTQSCVKHYFQHDLFKIVRGQIDGVPRKPDPIGVFEIVKTLEVKLGDCLFVGDTKVDMMTAKAARILCTGVTWGFRPQYELETNGADYLAHRPSDLIEILEHL